MITIWDSTSLDTLIETQSNQGGTFELLSTDVLKASVSFIPYLKSHINRLKKNVEPRKTVPELNLGDQKDVQ